MAMEASRTYVVSLTRVAVTIAKTLIQIKAGSVPLELIRAMVDQTSSVTPTKQAVQINRKSAAGTVTSFTPLKLGPTTDPAASAVGGTAATGINATAEGTDTDILVQGVLEYANGWIWLPTKEERIYVPAGGIVGLEFPVAPGASVTVTADLFFRELG